MSQELLYQIWRGTDPPRAKSSDFLQPHLKSSCIFKDFNPGIHIVYVNVIPIASWQFPSIHVAVPFSSVSQVLFIILGSKPPSFHREVSWESLYQIWRGTDLTEPKSCNLLHPSAGKLKLVVTLSMSRESPWHHYWESTLVQAFMTFILTNIDSAISISLWFRLKIAAANRIVIPGRECNMICRYIFYCLSYSTPILLTTCRVAAILSR